MTNARRPAWAHVLAVTLPIGGLVAGIAWAETSVFCEPGLLQGNPICALLILLGGGGLGFLGLGLGALLLWLAGGQAAVPGRRPSEGAPSYGPGVRAGAAIGTVLMCVLYFLLGPWRDKHDVSPEVSLALGLLFCLPLAVGVTLGAWFDRRS